MLPSRPLLHFLASTVLLVAGATTFAQEYPNKPLRILTGTAGSNSDQQSRLVAPVLSGALGQPVAVVNIPQDSQGQVARAAPDGYSLLLNGGGTWVGPLVQASSYEFERDLTGVSQISRDAQVVAVHPSVPANTIKELIAYAKARPGELNYAVGQPGGAAWLSAELLRSMAGINTVRIPFKGGGPAIAALAGGQVHMAVLEIGLVLPLARSGKLRALAVTSATPSTLAPDLPTVAASGLPGFEVVGMTGVLAPSKTPRPIINRLNQEIVRFLRTTEAKEAFLKLGAEVTDSTPDEFMARIRSDIANTIKLLKETGIKE